MNSQDIGIVPEPFHFNALKHHLGYIKDFIRNYRQDHTGLKQDLLSVGNSQMDLYIGPLSINKIVQDIMEYISDSFIDDKDHYSKYIHELNGYSKICISDGSKWVLREGQLPERYIHFHPARQSPGTVRIKANTLKSLIAASITFHGEIRLPELNHARKFLGLDPLSRMYSNTEILNHFNRIFRTKDN